jgi:hypothetical protein
VPSRSGAPSDAAQSPAFLTLAFPKLRRFLRDLRPMILNCSRLRWIAPFVPTQLRRSQLENVSTIRQCRARDNQESFRWRTSRFLLLWLSSLFAHGDGNVTQSKVAWKSSEGVPYVPSPISVGDWFFTSSFAGKAAHCFEASTGKILWKDPMGLHHASPVSANGLVYFLNDDGVMHIVKAGPKYEQVARSELGEDIRLAGLERGPDVPAGVQEPLLHR